MRTRSPQTRLRAAFSLVEVLIALGAIGFLASTIIYAFLVLNKATARQRELTNAKALCQDRIEECLSVTYDPANNVVPSILATGTTTTDSVKVYVKQDNTSLVIPGTRTVTIGTADASLKLLQVTVKVAYNYQGRPYTFQMATLRAPD